MIGIESPECVLKPGLHPPKAVSVLIEIPVGEMPDPWPHVVLPKVRGEGAKQSG